MLLAFTAMLAPSGATNTCAASTRYVIVRGPPGVLTTRLVTIGGAGTRRVVPACRSTTKGRRQAGGALWQGTVSGSVLSWVDAETNAMMLPSSLTSGAKLGRSAWPRRTPR